MEALVLVLLCLTASFILSEFLVGLKMPRILGPLIIGLVLGLPVVYDMFFTVEANISLMEAFANLGLIFLMFYIGLSVEARKFKKDSKQSIWISVFNALVPFIFGFFLVVAMSKLGLLDSINVYVTAIIVGICLSITSEAVSLEILEGMKLLKTKIGNLIMTIGILDDAFEVAALACVLAFAFVATTGVGFAVMSLLIGIIGFIVLILIARFLIIPFIIKFVSKTKSEIDLFIATLIFALFIAVVAEYLLLGAAIGALLAGSVMRYTLFRKHDVKDTRKVMELMKVTTYGFLAPFFFIWIGMHANFSVMLTNPLFAVSIVFLAFLGKMIGTLIGNKIGGGKLKESLLISWGTNPRGALALVVAMLAMTNAFISAEVFSALVLMAFLTTMFSPIMFRYLAGKYMKG